MAVIAAGTVVGGQRSIGARGCDETATTAGGMQCRGSGDEAVVAVVVLVAAAELLAKIDLHGDGNERADLALVGTAPVAGGVVVDGYRSRLLDVVTGHAASSLRYRSHSPSWCLGRAHHHALPSSSVFLAPQKWPAFSAAQDWNSDSVSSVW